MIDLYINLENFLNISHYQIWFITIFAADISLLYSYTKYDKLYLTNSRFLSIKWKMGFMWLFGSKIIMYKNK